MQAVLVSRASSRGGGGERRKHGRGKRTRLERKNKEDAKRAERMKHGMNMIQMFTVRGETSKETRMKYKRQKQACNMNCKSWFVRLQGLAGLAGRQNFDS
jgi:hypothetical protein